MIAITPQRRIKLSESAMNSTRFIGGGRCFRHHVDDIINPYSIFRLADTNLANSDAYVLRLNVTGANCKENKAKCMTSDVNFPYLSLQLINA